MRCLILDKTTTMKMDAISPCFLITVHLVSFRITHAALPSLLWLSDSLPRSLSTYLSFSLWLEPHLSPSYSFSRRDCNSSSPVVGSLVSLYNPFLTVRRCWFSSFKNTREKYNYFTFYDAENVWNFSYLPVCMLEKCWCVQWISFE